MEMTVTGESQMKKNGGMNMSFQREGRGSGSVSDQTDELNKLAKDWAAIKKA